MNEMIEVIEMTGEIICDVIEDNIEIFMKPDFYKELIEIIEYEVYSYFPDDIDIDEDLINFFIEFNTKLALNYIYLPRSISDMEYFSNIDVDIVKQQIEYLKNVPQPEQRTKEWYEYRQNHLTASSLWKIFSTKSAQNQLILSKCQPINPDKYKNVSLTSPLHWGQKYEEVSVKFYEHKFNVNIDEFGCIPHKKLDFLAASPDGIVTTSNNNKYGRMIEIKNVVSRKLTGIPKMDYWVQMQIQMEVCNLDHCDFLETKFIEYDNIIDFDKDGTFTESNDKKYKGVILRFERKDGTTYYKYPPWGISHEMFNIWFNDNVNDEFIEKKYWKLDDYSLVYVPRNKLWFNSIVNKLEKFWKIIEEDKKNGYEHRKPNSRNTIKKNIKVIKSNCIIDLTN